MVIDLDKCIILNELFVPVGSKRFAMFITPETILDVSIIELGEYNRYEVYRGLKGKQFIDLVEQNPDAVWDNFSLGKNGFLRFNSSVEFRELNHEAFTPDFEVSKVEFRATLFSLLRMLITENCKLVITESNSVSSVESGGNGGAGVGDVGGVGSLADVDSTDEVDLSQPASPTTRTDWFEVVDEQLGESQQLLKGVLQRDILDLVPFHKIRCSKTSDNITVPYRTKDGGFRTKIVWSISDPKYQGYWRVRTSGDALTILNQVYKGCLMEVEGDEVVIDPTRITQIALPMRDFFSIGSAALIATQIAYREYIASARNAVVYSDYVLALLNNIPRLEDAPREHQSCARTEYLTNIKYLVHVDGPKQSYLKSICLDQRRKFVLTAFINAFNGKISMMDCITQFVPQSGILFDVFRQVFCDTITSAPKAYDKTYFADIATDYQIMLAVQDSYMFELKAMLMEYEFIPEALRSTAKTSGIEVTIME